MVEHLPAKEIFSVKAAIDLLEWQLGLDAAIPSFSQVDAKNLRYIIDPAVSKLTVIKKTNAQLKYVFCREPGKDLDEVWSK